MVVERVVVRTWCSELGYGSFCDRCIERETLTCYVELVSDSEPGTLCATCGRGASAS